jgi:hypothetical protein
VPFKLSGNHIFVKAMVDGKDFAFVFDTAGAATLTPRARDSLRLSTIAQAQIVGAGNAPATLDIVRAKVASIGDARLEDGMFLVLSNDLGLVSPYPNVPLGGILGREFFASLVLTIDYANATLTLTNPSVFQAAPAAQALPMAMRQGVFPNVEASVDGATASFDIDAGSANGVMLTKAFADAHGIRGKMAKTVAVDAGHGVGGALGGVAGRVKTFSLGDASFDNPIAVVTDAKGGAFATPGLGGNIGYDILRRFTVTIDAPGRMLYLTRNAAFGEPFAFTRSGLFLNRDGGKIVVTLVSEGSPAQRAGVRPGDVLVKLDGKPVASLTADQLHAVSLQPAGTVVDAVLERDGRSVKVALTLRDLL